MPSFGGGQFASRVGILFAPAACARPQSLYEHGEAGRNCRLRMIDEHSERHGDG
jgi:hypothetical protein